MGPAWYQRTVTIPEVYRDKRIVLLLERCHWETQVWVDEQYVGMQNSLCTPQEHDLSGVLSPGEHTLTLRVDNTVKINVGENAHSVSDNTQSNWNGVAGTLALVVRDPVWVSDVQVYPDMERDTARVRVALSNATGVPVEGRLTLSAKSWNGPEEHAVPDLQVPFNAKDADRVVEVDYPLGARVQYWSESSPALYRLTVALDAATHRDTRHVDFGMRSLSTEGTQFTLNGKKIFLRGTLECCIFPLTSYPPTDVDAWLRILRIAKAHGLNHLRFHSWCPPEAAFAAADQMGFLFHVECAAWAKIGDGEAIDDFIYAEGDRILQAYGNHPSFCMLAYGNEPGGRRQKEFLGKLVDYWKAKDDRHLYTSAAGWPIIPENQFHSTPSPRVHAWGAGLGSRFNAEAFASRSDYRDFVSQHKVPVVSHEIGQWCVYPNLREMEKYTGTLKARNFEIFRDTLEANHMLGQADAFLMASGKLQTLCYKEDIEAALRTPGFGGFQLLDLHDFPGQGTALVGVLDPFWDAKGYVTAEAFRCFSGETVPLLRMDKCIWTTDETFTGDAEIAHFGAAPLDAAQPRWAIAGSDGSAIASGELATTTIPIGNGFSLGKIAYDLDGVAAPQQLKLTLALDGTPYRNAWDLWVYPPNVETAPAQDILVAHELDEQVLDTLERGGKVLLLPAPGTVAGDARGQVPAGFSPIFWNTYWTNFQPPHTLGILCDPAHPALARFPTEFHSNWQWWDLIHGGQIMILDGLPKELRPTVQVIDDWTSNRRLGLVFEAQVGGGSLLVCGSDIARDLDTRPVARQMRHSLLAYMASDGFHPGVRVEPEAIAGLFKPPSRMRELVSRVTADGAQPGHEVESIIDGDTGTFWHTPWGDETPDYPHWLVIELKQSVEIEGFSILPRQDMTNGRIGRYAVHVSDNGEDWGQSVKRGRFEAGAARKEATFSRPRQGRYVRLLASAPVDRSHPWATIAELELTIADEE